MAIGIKKDVKFSVDVSRGFKEWLNKKNASLVVTTYQVGKVIFFGIDANKRLWIYNRNLGRCLGMAADSNGFWVSSDTQIYRFDNVLKQGEIGPNGVDKLFVPRLSFFTGDVDIHDVALSGKGRPYFINTLFNCIARPSLTHSFEMVWKPEFISRLAAEDRCHLNGLAMQEGKPKYVTAVSCSDVFDGWRDHREKGGVIIDVTSNDIVCNGLSMPHSPRLKDDVLWVHNSGKGEFGYVDLKAGKFEPIAFCPGYLRGLAFIDDIAVVGLSLPRGNKTFEGLPLGGILESKAVNARRGLCFIDLKNGDIIHSLFFDGIVTELYDVAILNKSKQPSMIGPNSAEIRRTLSIPHN